MGEVLVVTSGKGGVGMSGKFAGASAKRYERSRGIL